MIDLFFVYWFLKRLASPFEEWDAYEMGVIDDKGNILIPKNQRSRDQKKAFTKGHVMVLNMKKLIEKVPVAQKKIATYAAALWLIKEGRIVESQMSEDVLLEYIEEVSHLYEEAPVNNIGSGNVAGAGINGPDDVVMRKTAMELYKKKNKKKREK